MYPTLETIKQLAQTKEYRRIPLCRVLYADRYTPVEVMRTLRKASRHCYLLESASQTEVWGRYSFLGYEPSMEITCTDGTLKIRTTDAEGKTEETVRQVTHPGDTLREIIRKYKTPVMEKMPPFTGGLVGYFSYDYIKYSEPKLKLEDKEQQDFRDMDLMLFDQVIVFDHFKQKVLLITGVMTDDLETSYEAAVKKLEEMAQFIRNGEHMEFEPLKLQSEIQPKFPKEKYAEMVEKAKHYIKEGDIFQVVLSNPMRAKATGSLFDTYRVLRATNPSPYMFYFSSDDIELAGLEVSLVNCMNREKMLKQVLDSAKREYDFILLDCMPSLGMLTINALAAADAALIPVQAQYLSAKGLEQLLQTVQKVRRQINPKLKIEGILLTMTDSRTNYGKQISNLIRQAYGKHLKVFEQTIPRSVRASETSAAGKSIFSYDPKGKVAEAYKSLAKEVLADADRQRKLSSERAR